jgi:hypothetical protein
MEDHLHHKKPRTVIGVTKHKWLFTSETACILDTVSSRPIIIIMAAEYDGQDRESVRNHCFRTITATYLKTKVSHS